MRRACRRSARAPATGEACCGGSRAIRSRWSPPRSWPRSCSPRSSRRCVAPADPYKGAMLRRLKPVGDALYLLGSDELGRDMLSRLIYGGRLSLFMGVLPVACAFAIGATLGLARRLRRRLGQHGDHADHRRVLRLPVGAAGDRAVGRARRRHLQRGGLAHHGVHPADRARRRGGHHPDPQPRLHRGGARERRRRARPSSASTCSATCWGRSSSTPPA